MSGVRPLRRKEWQCSHCGKWVDSAYPEHAHYTFKPSPYVWGEPPLVTAGEVFTFTVRRENSDPERFV
jgi:hypothetical protein